MRGDEPSLFSFLPILALARISLQGLPIFRLIHKPLPKEKFCHCLEVLFWWRSKCYRYE